jgi:hypothetical protein
MFYVACIVTRVRPVEYADMFRMILVSPSERHHKGESYSRYQVSLTSLLMRADN